MPPSSERKESTLLKESARTKVQKVRAKTGLDEKILHVPSEVGMLFAALVSVVPFGALAVLGLVVVILVAALVIS